ncbi:MAG: mevalonate kinase [Euryarchaeota archaeon]|nr:mevalonate kinase [Euryarchaeota archaeon]MDE1880608.1 mevalonate kinase [Euryarchaeota archaeon]MDE2044386.1 mevalonate kinase [Thermoplasmata archaeon]
MNDAIPPARAPLRARAPGKAILFGEHAVVFGRTAVVLALELGTEVAIDEGAPGGESTYNGSAEAARSNPYLQEALRSHSAGHALALNVRSDIPKASGLGSSAAFTAALMAGLLSLQGGSSRARLAEESFRTERGAQGVGSPVDTSAAVAGGVLTVGHQGLPGATALWSLPAVDGGPPWSVGRVPDPGWTWVVGYTGVPKDTATVVRRVGERVKRPDGERLLDEIAHVAVEGVEALRAKDRAAVGRAMKENQRLLVDLGISHPRLEELLASIDRYALGAKITGAGGGGSVVALPREGEEVLVGRAISHAGGVPFLVRVAPSGAALEA